jgi:hypothetical protein
MHHGPAACQWVAAVVITVEGCQKGSGGIKFQWHKVSVVMKRWHNVSVVMKRWHKVSAVMKRWHTVKSSFQPTGIGDRVAIVAHFWQSMNIMKNQSLDTSLVLCFACGGSRL